jgi:predicted Zn-dependent protease
MSVINRMLRDIENRNQKPTADSLVGQAVALPSKANQQQWLIIGLSAVVVLLISYLVFDKLSSSSLVSDQSSSQSSSTNLVADEESIQTSNAQLESLVADQKPLINSQKNDKANLQAESQASEQTDLIDTENANLQASLKTNLKTGLKENQPLETNPVVQQMPEPMPEQSSRVVKSAPKLSATQEAQNFYQQAQVAISDGNPQQALILLEKALSFDNKLHNAKILQLTLLNRQGNDINNQLDRLISGYPKIYHYRQMKARLLLEAGQLNEAQSLLEAELPLITEAPDYYATLAYIAQQQGGAKLAADYYQQLLRVEPARADWWFGLALANQQQGKSTLALQAYQQSLNAIGLSENLRQYAAQQIGILQGK